METKNTQKCGIQDFFQYFNHVLDIEKTGMFLTKFIEYCKCNKNKQNIKEEENNK